MLAGSPVARGVAGQVRVDVEGGGGAGVAKLAGDELLVRVLAGSPHARGKVRVDDEGGGGACLVARPEHDSVKGEGPLSRAFR